MVRVALISLAVLLVLYAALIAGLMLAGKRVAAKEVATLVPNLVLLFKDLLKDQRVPRSAKVWLVVGCCGSRRRSTCSRSSSPY